MSTTQRAFSPEERQSYRAWLFGTTLDWESLILAEIDYPAEGRWFVDSVQGICQKAPPKVKGKGVPIAHSVLAKRACRFKNKSQAKELTKRAIAEDREWSRLKRMMIFDIEPPKPGQMEGKDKRARTKYTDYLTPAAVYAQDVEHRVKKSDEVSWKDAKYRTAKRRAILEEAIKMLPAFGKAEDMPASCRKKEKKPLSMSEYIAQREKILLAENKRVLDCLLEGDLATREEISERLMQLQLFFEKTSHEQEERYQSTRELLVGMLDSRPEAATDASEESDSAPLLEVLDTPYNQSATQDCKGNVGIPLSGGPVEADLESVLAGLRLAPDKESFDALVAQARELGATDDEIDEAVRGTVEVEKEPVEVSQKGNVHIPLVDRVAVLPDEGESEPNMGVWALYWVTVEGIPVVPAYTTEGRKCACHLGDKCRSAGKHPMHDARDLPDGLENATTDPEQVKIWWQRWPRANILGRMRDKRRLGVDVDVQAGGDASLYDLTEAHGEGWLQTRTHKSGNGGPHLFYTVPDGVDFRKGKLAPGIDLKWTNGGMILPPSIHWTGNRYEVIDPVQELEAPDWMLDDLTRKPGQQAGKVIDFQEGAQKFSDGSKQKFYESSHERNNGLFGVLYGRWLHGHMENNADLYQQAHSINQGRCVPPLDDDEVEQVCSDFIRNYGHLKDSQKEATA